MQNLLDLQTGSISAASLNVSAASVESAAAPELTDATCANDPNCYYSIDWNREQKYLFIYHLFSLLWVYQFIVGFG
jgi:hypothetical protein